MSGIGHNRGPSMEKKAGWRRYAWKRARADLLPKMPIEVVRLRVKRARELGIDYKAYAGIRATTGRDVIAFLFSDNALRLAKDAKLPKDRKAHLEALIDADCMGLVHAPLHPDMVIAQNPVILRAGMAPLVHASWQETRARLLSVMHKTPADGIVVVGDTWAEKEWCATARLAGYLSAEHYFGAPPSRVFPEL